MTERFRVCRHCGTLKALVDLEMVEVRPDLHPPRVPICESCLSAGNKALKYLKRPDGTFLEVGEPVWVWCLDCDWESEVPDNPVRGIAPPEERAKRAAAGHIGNNNRCDDYEIGTFPTDHD